MQPKTLIVRASAKSKSTANSPKKLFASIFEFADALTNNVLGPLSPVNDYKKKRVSQLLLKSH